jgi:hypothetical protein
MIYFAVQCHNFQLRLAWQLSSILQQVGAPEITIDVAHMPVNGRPTTELVCAKFRNKGMTIRETVIEDPDLFAKRGLVRNCQIQNADADWMFFADCDNVYPPEFFRCLQQRLDELGEDHDGVLYVKEKKHTEREIDKWMQLVYIQPCIRFAYRRAAEMPMSGKRNKGAAAGCMQVISCKRLDYYVDPAKCRDSHLFKSGQRAKSDKQFRRRMGGSHRIHLDCPPQIHLNHQRDKEAGRHLEGQR